jgi:succinoglycan biosynthesis transport protein ExoP
MRAGTTSGSYASSGEMDFASLGRRLWAKRWRIIIPGILAGVLAIVAVNAITPKYKSDARVLIEGRENIFLRPEADKINNDRLPVDMEALSSQVQILQSRDLALQVIRQLKLTDKPEFDSALKGVSTTSVLMSLIGLGRDALRMTPEERTLEVYFQRLAVVPVEKSRVITVEFMSADPELAARIVNAIVDGYLVLQQENKTDQTRAASQWLSGEIASLRNKVADAEGKVEEFRAKANLFPGANNLSLANQQVSELTTQLAAARTQKADLEAKSRVVQNLLRSGKPIETAEVTGSDMFRRLVEQRVTLRSQLAEQSSTLLDEHPRIKELRAQIGALDLQIRGELERLSRSMENDVKVATVRIDGLTSNLQQLKQAAAANGGQEVQLRALDREAKAQRDLLENYLAKYREATARESIDVAPTDARIISRAVASNMVAYPKKVPIVLIATLGTMFVMATLIVTGAFLSGGAPYQPDVGVRAARVNAFSPWEFFRRRKDRNAARPVAVPAHASPPAAPPFRPVSMPLPEVARSFRALGDAGRRITVIGAARNVGTTFTAIGLARALAHDAKVILIDLAFNASNLSIISTDPGAPGIADLIRGHASFGSIITRDQFSRVHLIATGQVTEADYNLLSSPRLAMMLEALVRTYDHVVVDAGAMAHAPINVIARLAPRAVLVATDFAHPDTRVARDRLLAAGFADVTLFLGTPGAAERAA